MTRLVIVRLIAVVLISNCALALECPDKELDGTCSLSVLHNETSTNKSQEMTTLTPKPASIPKSMNMLAEDQIDSVFRPTVPPLNITNNSTEEPKGRALNFSLNGHNTGNIISNGTNRDDFGDLSDVSINEDDDEILDPKILAPKFIANNKTVGICEKGGLTYENGEKLENGCDSVCTCMNGKMDCQDRCSGPYFRKGKRIDDPLCTTKEAEDPCCSILICSADTETEPLELCSFNNKTYNRGDMFNNNCEVCFCEAAGNVSCKSRCPVVNKTSDRCVEVQDPSDSCCKKILCDVTLDDNEPEKIEEAPKRKLLSAKFLNKTIIELKFDSKFDANETLPLIETSYDRKLWKTDKIKSNKFIEVKNAVKYIKVENSDEILDIEDKDVGPQEIDNFKGCVYNGQNFDIGQEFNDNCSSLCVCQKTGMKCLKLECPTYFGVDVLDPNCIEWETIPPNFVPSPPNCCPEKLHCKYNGSCMYEEQMYQNWQQLPINVTGCEKRCYCEMGNVECQNTCPPITPHPPQTLDCLPHHYPIIDHIPEDDCCMYWVCKQSPSTLETDRDKTETTDKEIKNITDPSFTMGSFNLHQNKTPSKILGPLLVYTNKDSSNNSITELEILPNITKEENPYFDKSKNSHKNKIVEPYLGTVNPTYKKPTDNQIKIPQKSKPSKNNVMFVTPPTSAQQNENIIPFQPLPEFPGKSNKTPQTQTHNKINPDELLHFINQHPEIANYPTGSVLEIHNIPINQKNPLNSQFINHNGVLPPNVRPHQQIIPYVIPQGPSHIDDLPPGVTLEQILQEIHKNVPVHPNNHFPPNQQYPTNNGPLIIPQQSGVINQNNRNSSYQGGQIFPGNFPGFQQPQDEVSVHVLEALDAHTVRLAFMVPPVIVGLHGRVEVRYTNKNDDDYNSWELQVFAPPNDLIATPQLEFDLLSLKEDTEYKIKITITLRDLHNTPTSRVYKIKTPKDTSPTTLPPMIPIEPELAITDINATWVTVVWRKFTEYELQFIDGVQLRFKEIEGKIYDATPLIHRSVTSYTLENLKANTKYEIGIFFIPFPGQLTELHAEHMLHFTTANEIDTYGFNVTLDVSHIKSTSVEIVWSGVPYPEDKYVNIYRAIYQSDSGKEDHSTFKIAKRDSPTKTVIMDLKPGTRYRLWLEVYLTNGKIKTSNVQDFITKPRAAPTLGASTHQVDKLLSAGEFKENKGDYYGPLVIVAILASIAIMSTLILLLILVRRHNQNKASITPPTRVSQSAYDNPTYKVEIQQETMGL